MHSIRNAKVGGSSPLSGIYFEFLKRKFINFVIQLGFQEEIMSEAKSFIIPKMLVMEAYKLVKANAGAAGVDKQTLVRRQD